MGCGEIGSTLAGKEEEEGVSIWEIAGWERTGIVSAWPNQGRYDGTAPQETERVSKIRICVSLEPNFFCAQLKTIYVGHHCST